MLAPAGGSELNVGVGPTGTIFVGGWDNIVKSTDGGVTWLQTSARNVGVLQASVAADRVLVVDKTTGRVFFDDTTLGCTVLSWSDDEGASWTRNPLACGASVTDHQKIAVGPRVDASNPTSLLYPNVVYVCANGLVQDACGVSLDGGLTFTTGVPHGVNCAFQGAPTVGADGVLYEGSHHCGGQLRFSEDEGRTWTARAVPVPVSGTTASVPSVTTTPDGTVYFLYQTPAFHVAYVSTKDKGLTWSAPVDLTPAGVTSTSFGVAVGGADGRLGVAFYGTTASPAGWSRAPGAAPASVAWYGYVSVVTGADTAAPTVQTTQVTPAADPLAYGCIGKDAGCGGNPIADYMGIDAGPAGEVVAVFMDACPPGCASAAQMGSAKAGVAVQTGGTNLRT